MTPALALFLFWLVTQQGATAPASSPTKPVRQNEKVWIETEPRPSSALPGKTPSPNTQPENTTFQVVTGPPVSGDHVQAEQASPDGAPAPIPMQVSQHPQSRLGLAQPRPAPASAAPPPALSQAADGRITAITALKGDDRCAANPGPELADVCARVIETRSDEFSIPDRSALSPEQRLLADQQSLESGPLDINSAARRLSAGKQDDTLAGLAVASVALSQPVGPTDQKKESETKTQAVPAVVDALVAAILQQTGGGPPPN